METKKELSENLNDRLIVLDKSLEIFNLSVCLATELSEDYCSNTNRQKYENYINIYKILYSNNTEPSKIYNEIVKRLVFINNTFEEIDGEEYLSLYDFEDSVKYVYPEGRLSSLIGGAIGNAIKSVDKLSFGKDIKIISKEKELTYNEFVEVLDDLNGR